MITRIVKMTFIPGKESDFLEIFKHVSPLIRSFEGCTHLELLRDNKNPSIFFTYSTWKSPENLEKYRNSDLFATTWGKTKKLFSNQAEAWSVKRVDTI